MAQGSGISIFSSKEQEYEQKAQLLKRLAFVILCSETDQYHKYMPEIQGESDFYRIREHTHIHKRIHTYNCWLVILLSERLADSLRLPQVIPSIQAQVFLCFRVLLLRMSPQHATSLWPVIVSELVQVFLYIEQELNTDSEEFRYANSSDSCCFRILSKLAYMGRYCFVYCCMMYVYFLRSPRAIGQFVLRYTVCVTSFPLCIFFSFFVCIQNRAVWLRRVRVDVQTDSLSYNESLAARELSVVHAWHDR